MTQGAVMGGRLEKNRGYAKGPSPFALTRRFASPSPASGRGKATTILGMQRAAVDRQGGFLDGFAQAGMGVAGAGDVFGGGAEFHG